MLKRNILYAIGICTLTTISSYAQSDLKIFAHRGFRGLHPENTIGAMKRALQYGAVLEMDLAVTKDKQVVVSHDPVLNPKTTLGPDGDELPSGQKIALYAMDYHELAQYDVGTKANTDFPDQMRYKAQIPRLTDLIDSVEQYAVQTGLDKPVYFVETKLKPATDNRLHPAPDEFADLLLAIISEKKISDRIIVQSFDPRTLQRIHRKHPGIPLAFLARKGTTLERNISWLGFTPAYYSADAEYITPELAEKCRKLGVTVLVGNCNSYQEFLRIEKLGIDAFISDYPVEYLREKK